MNTALRFVTTLSTAAIMGVVSIDVSAASIRVRCEQSATRSKISVDAGDLLSGNYRARVISGSNSRNTRLAPTIGDEVAFDYDSATNEPGAYAITPNFIQNLAVVGKIIDEFGRTVASDTELCKAK